MATTQRLALAGALAVALAACAKGKDDKAAYELDGKKGLH